jgi:hypothetical protein
MFEKVTIITLLFLTTLGDIKMESFEVVSGETCESWYHHNVKVTERKKRLVFGTKVKMLLVIFVVMNHHNKPIPTREKRDRLLKVRKDN